jgi:hypothetical protein
MGNSPLRRNLSLNLLYLAQSSSTPWSLEGPARPLGGSRLGRGSECSCSSNFPDFLENDPGCGLVDNFQVLCHSKIVHCCRFRAHGWIAGTGSGCVE